MLCLKGDLLVILLFGGQGHVDGLSEMDTRQHGVVRVGKVELAFYDVVDLAHREISPSTRRMLAVESQIAGHVARHLGRIAVDAQAEPGRTAQYEAIGLES